MESTFLQIQPQTETETQSKTQTQTQTQSTNPETTLLPGGAPPPEVAEVIKYGSKETSRAYRTPLFQKSQAWLKQALVEAHRSHQIKETAVKLLQRDLFCRNLAVYNVEGDADADDPPKKTLYEDLTDHARREGVKLGDAMHQYYADENLGESLGKIQVRNHKGREWRTQECFVKLAAPCSFRDRGLTYEAEYVYIHVLRMVAMAINDDYQELVAKLAQQVNGHHKSADIKGVPRMMNKLKARDDHRVMPDFLLDQQMVYRAGQNIDINRNAVTFQTVPEMIAFIGLLEDVFDGVARTKNMFAFPLERAAEQLHYRTTMMNMVWPPPEGNFARTFGELAAKARPLWDRYENDVRPDTTFPKEHYQDRIQVARAHLEALAATNTPLHFIVESQVLLQKYLEGRTAMHLLYVLVVIHSVPYRTAPHCLSFLGHRMRQICTFCFRSVVVCCCISQVQSDSL